MVLEGQAHNIHNHIDHHMLEIKLKNVDEVKVA